MKITYPTYPAILFNCFSIHYKGKIIKKYSYPNLPKPTQHKKIEWVGCFLKWVGWSKIKSKLITLLKLSLLIDYCLWVGWVG